MALGLVRKADGSIGEQTLGQAAMAASFPVALASDQSALPMTLATAPALVAGNAVIGKVGIDQTTPGTTNLVQVGGSLPAGTAAIGKLTANSGVDIGDVDVTSIAAGENHLGEVGGRTVKVNSFFTRPADTAPYAAGDALADSTSAPTVNTITNAARINAGSGVILNATLLDSANVAAAGSFEVWIFDTTWTPDNDNAVFTPTDAELATLVAIVPFNISYVGDATAGAGGNRIYQSDPVNRGFVCGAASRNLFWALVVRNIFTPVSAEIFTLRLTILQD